MQLTRDLFAIAKFLLTIETPFPFVPAAFNNGKWRFHASRQIWSEYKVKHCWLTIVLNLITFQISE